MQHIRLKTPFEVQLLKEPLVACIGYFDGLHLGHQVLFDTVFQEATHSNLPRALITFEPDPWSVVHGNHKINHITPYKTKIELLERLGFDVLITVEFTKETMALTPQQFIEHLLVSVNVSTLVVGPDFRFGANREGTVETLKTLGNRFFKTVVVEPLSTQDHKVGTTEITQSILRGNIKAANRDLGRDYMMSGVVIDGNKQGRLIGFPTANLSITDEYVVPKPGVYAGYTIIDGKTYLTATSIGYNVTFNTSDRLSFEAYILDFEGDLYGSWLRHFFLDHIRDEIKFNSIEALIQQIQADVDLVREKWSHVIA